MTVADRAAASSRHRLAPRRCGVPGAVARARAARRARCAGAAVLAGAAQRRALARRGARACGGGALQLWTPPPDRCCRGLRRLQQPHASDCGSGRTRRGPVGRCWCPLACCCWAPGASFPRPSTSSAARIPASTSARGCRSRSAARCRRPTPSSRRCRTSRGICSSPRSNADRLLQRPLHGLLHPGARPRACRRPVPAPVPRLDRARLRPRRTDRRKTHDVSVGNPRRARRVLRWRAAGRPRGSGCGRRTARAARHRGVVRALSERGSRDAATAVRRAARECPRAPGRRPASSRRWRDCCSACCCSSGSMPCSALPASSAGWRSRR